MLAKTRAPVRTLILGLVGSFLGIGPVPACRDTDVVAPESEAINADEEDSLQQGLDLLWSGRPEEKRLAVEQVYDWAEGLDFDDAGDATAAGAVKSLHAFLRAEPDDWIVSRLLQNLLPRGGALLDPLYREALERGSVNSQWRAVQWFARRADPLALPLLEDLWRIEDRPWVRVDLMEALALNRSSVIFDDLVDYTDGPNPDLALAAVRAIRRIGGEEALEELIRLSREERVAVAAEAVGSLADWPDSPEAFEALLEATRSRDEEVGVAAVAILRTFKTEQAVQRLMDVARHGGEPMRRAALDSLGDSPPEGFADLLVTLAKETPGSEAVLESLRKLDDISVVRKLEQILPDAGEEYRVALEDLIQHLERYHTPDMGTVTSHCGGVVSMKPGPGYRIRPAGDLKTIRCWQFPEVAGPPGDFPRIPEGAKVTVQDHFEIGGRSWVEVWGEEAEGCWVPLDVLAPDDSQGPEEESSMEVFRREADVARRDLRSGAAQALWEARILEVVDETEEVVGIVLSLDPLDRRALRTLKDSYRDDDSDLDYEISELLDELLDAASERPELRSVLLDATGGDRGPRAGQDVEDR